MQKRVIVGLSGGVDSATSAALLKERGYDVAGGFIKIWSPEFLECTWREDRLDAMRVCAALGIPFLEVDLSDEYKKEVVADMLSQYRRGVTPNPDVLCNRSIKFGHFASWARGQGADCIATGHYARIASEGGRHFLLRGKDPGKDQSYFLYQLEERDLARTIFPIGGLEKSDVRALARKFGLPNAKRPDSQGLCFVGDVSMKEFLGRFIALQEGDVVDEKGDTIGTHDGAPLYTVGERHGFRSNGSEPQFVVGTDIEKNLVRVSPRRADAMRSFVEIEHAHWISSAPEEGTLVEVQARYREKPIQARLRGSALTFTQPHIAAPGQSLVVYDKERCLGGGIIANK